MSLCENHPNQLATGKCSVCGRHVCGICSTTNDGAITCFSCDERTEWVQSGSPWDRAQSPWETGAIMDTRTKNYLLLGAIGSVLWLFILLASAIQYWMIIVGSYTNPMIYVLSIPVSIISLVQPILLGLGFLGFYYKYDHKPSRYVLFLGIAIILINLLFNVLLGSLPIEALVYSPIYSFILIATVYASAAIPLLYYVLVLYCLVTLRKGLRRP
ncbi:MAG: B-box zinc finger protein, partial [Candidatus Thorarchaeota archaeon]